MKSQKEIGMSGVTPKFDQNKLDRALLDSFDLMQRCLLDTVYIVAGDAARCLKENRGLDCDKIEFVINRRYVTPEVRSTLVNYVEGSLDSSGYPNGKVTRDGFSYEFEGVPVSCKFIDRSYRWFDYADQRFYGPENYRIPNQFDRYWKARFIVR